jgi:hypothetical protein
MRKFAISIMNDHELVKDPTKEIIFGMACEEDMDEDLTIACLLNMDVSEYYTKLVNDFNGKKTSYGVYFKSKAAYCQAVMWLQSVMTMKAIERSLQY